MSQAQVNAILDYWFGTTSPVDPAFMKLWFRGGDDVDMEIERNFGAVHETLRNGLPNDWPDSGEGLLAAIIVIDQFSRNLFRKQAEAFAWDSAAQQWALRGWEQGLFDALALEHKAFSLMPFMHSESIALHDLGIEHFKALMASMPATDTIITGFYSSALEHRDIIASFGRYPHRNAVLGRESTPEELAYLNNDGKRFGQ